MCTNALAKLETDASTAKRAQYEAFEFALEASGLVQVTNGSYGVDADDHSYRVNVEGGVPVACECPADTYRAGACKHRVAVAIGTRPIPAGVAAIDPSLGEHTTSGPARSIERADDRRQAVATDGGQVLAERTESDESDRPDDCSCLPSFDDLPCFECYRDGFESPNPDATEDNQ